jgi:endoglucanase
MKLILLSTATTLLGTMALPSTTHAATPGAAPVAPNALVLSFVDGKITKGLRGTYEPMEGDEIEQSGETLPAWTPDGIQKVQTRQMLHRMIDGQRESVGFIFQPRGEEARYLWREEKHRTPWQNGVLEDTARYGLSSAEDPRFADGLGPIAVHRKTKPVDGNEITGDKILAHDITLVWPYALQEGANYKLTYPKADASPATMEYKHDSRATESPAIHVNHIGYRPGDPFKRAFLSFWTGSGNGTHHDAGIFSLLEADSGRVVFEGKIGPDFPADRPEAFRTERNFVGADVRVMDFSEFEEPGTYRVHVPGVGVSPPFVIDEGNSWASAFRISMRGFLHHRSGIALGPPFTSYERPRPMHPEDGVRIFKIPQTMLEGEVDAVRAGIGEKMASGLDAADWPVHEAAWGGYMDAGDWDRRSQHLSASRHLAELFLTNPEFFANLPLDLPPNETEDGISDILNEVAWNVDFYRRLQDPDGGVRGGVESTCHPLPGEASWEESLVLAVFAPDPFTSYSYAATAALLSRALAPYDVKLAAEYQASAQRAWVWAEENRERVLGEAEARSKKADESRFSRQEADTRVQAMRFVAAADLFSLTGEQRFHEAFSQMLPDAGTDPDELGAMFRYAMLPDEKTDTALRKEIVLRITRLADSALEFGEGNAFGITTHARFLPVMGYTGFYSVPETITGPVLPRAHLLTGEEKYLRGALRAAHFSAGANPLNMTFTTGVGHDWPRNPLHIDSRVTGQPAPDGITIYGPMDAAEDFAFNDWVHKWHLQDMHPPSRTWPAAQWHVDYFRWPAMSEYTIHQTFRPTAYYWGYLASRPSVGKQEAAQKKTP